MDQRAADPFAPSAVRSARVDVYTAAYRVSGVTATHHGRVADILNQATSTHLIIEEATISEYTDPSATLGARQALVSIDEVLIMVAADAEGGLRPEMRIPKRAVKAHMAIPPFRLTGAVHVPQGSRPVDGLLNSSERFLAMTEVTIASGAHPELGRSAEAIAVQRRLVHVILVQDDERPDELLADVLDQQTAERWLNPRDSEERS